MKQTPTDRLKKELESASKRIRELEWECALLLQKDGQQKNTLQSLTRSEAFLAQSVRMTRLAFSIWDYNLDRDIAVTEELANIYGLTKDEYCKIVQSMDSHLEFVVPEDRNKYKEFENQLTPTSDVRGAGIEYRIMRPDGKIRHLHQRSQYIPVASGHPSQAIVVIQDMTERVKVENELRKSQVRYNQAEQLGKLGYWEWDHIDNKMTSCSEQFAKFYGMTLDEALAFHSSVEQEISTIHPGDRERYQNHIVETEEQLVGMDIEFRVIALDQTRHVHLQSELVLDDENRIVRSFGTEQDISDRIEREFELSEAKNSAEQASVAKSAFLAMMSHEIRTPLNAVLGSLGIMDSEKLDPSLRKYLNVGRNGAESLFSIINDILDFSKMEAGKLQLEPALFRAPKIIDGVLLVLENRAKEKNISLTGVLESDVPEFLIGDLGRIRQVLLNLCSNAVRFTTDGGVLISISKLGLQDETTHLRLEVKDTGCGVPLEDQDHLFEEFWGTNTTTLGDIGSTGLGLPICKHLVEMMDGSIGFESSPGRGSLFWFEIPLRTADEAAVRFEKNKPNALDNSVAQSNLPTLRARVLLAEDNPANQLIARTVLERLGLKVSVVANGYEAVAAIRSTPYDVVLMDINMPEMDGIEATAAIRKLPGAFSNVPIIAMTALAMPGDRERFLSEGMDGYISKPIIREELHACIAKFLEGVEPHPSATINSSEINVTSSETQIFNTKIFTELKEIVGPEHLPKIIELYLSQVPEQVATITDAAACGDYKLVAKDAHNLISSSAYMGATGLSALASRLERAARNRDLKKIQHEVVHLPDLLEQTLNELTDLGKHK